MYGEDLVGHGKHVARDKEFYLGLGKGGVL